MSCQLVHSDHDTEYIQKRHINEHSSVMHDKATSRLKGVVVRKMVLSVEDVIRSRVYYMGIVMSIKILCGKYTRTE